MEDVRRLPVGGNDEGRVTLDDLAREGARRMIAAALEAEVEEYVSSLTEEVGEDGQRLVVRNGRARERRVTVGSGTVSIRAPRVNDKRVEEETGKRRRFSSGKPMLVQTHDFPDPRLGTGVPYGIYDIARDEGYVSVGVSGDTAEFSVASIEAWWNDLGSKDRPEASTLTITADCGGSNSYRTRLWKTELQGLADRTGLRIQVLHYPPDTSKWNRIEHRLFSHISINWRAKPLTSYQVMIDLIAATTTSTGLDVFARLDDQTYETSIKVSDEQLAAVNIHRDAFHGEWNYTISPSVE